MSEITVFIEQVGEKFQAVTKTPAGDEYRSDIFDSEQEALPAYRTMIELVKQTMGDSIKQIHWPN